MPLWLERNGDRMRLITRGGYNWTDRYPWIVDAARKNRIRQFVIDGEDLRRLCANVNFTLAGACSGFDFNLGPRFFPAFVWRFINPCARKYEVDCALEHF